MVPSMGITNNHNFLSNRGTSDDPLEKIIDKYKNQPSITCINKHMTISELPFTFQLVTKNQISTLIQPLNDKKVFNHCITEGNFIADFKVAEVRPLYINDGRADKSNYRPISILSNVSKIYS